MILRQSYFCNMYIDYLVIGQGISGTWLSYYLQKEGKSFLVIDNNKPNASSRLAAGIINPVTGRRHVEVWLSDEILPFAWQAYNQLGNELDISAISTKSVIDFFPSPQMKLSFQKRIEEKGNFVFDYPDQNHFTSLFHYELGCGEVKPVYIAHLENIIPAWRQKLKSGSVLIEEQFDIDNLSVTATSVQYKDIVAEKIIFCDGYDGGNNPYFKLLPFAPNKGELLIAEIPGLPANHIYKKGMIMVPLATPGMWWVGSNYHWEFDTDQPTKEFREKTEQLLRDWLKVPFTIAAHHCGIRPATLERRPFVGLHPVYPAIGILNGMGTKGSSLAPFFARQMADHMLYNHPIHPEADVNRFSKILSRNIS